VYVGDKDEKLNTIGVRARGAGGLQPHAWAKPAFFGQKLNFSGKRRQPKMKNKYFCVFIK